MFVVSIYRKTSAEMNENVKISKHFLIWYRTEILICNPKSENQIEIMKNRTVNLTQQIDFQIEP